VQPNIVCSIWTTNPVLQLPRLRSPTSLLPDWPEMCSVCTGHETSQHPCETLSCKTGSLHPRINQVLQLRQPPQGDRPPMPNEDESVTRIPPPVPDLQRVPSSKELDLTFIVLYAVSYLVIPSVLCIWISVSMLCI
jgi:hypothetical protein